MGLSEKEKKRLGRVRENRFNLATGIPMGSQRETSNDGKVLDDHFPVTSDLDALKRNIKAGFRRILKKP